MSFCLDGTCPTSHVQVGLVFQFPERHFLGEDLLQVGGWKLMIGTIMIVAVP